MNKQLNRAVMIVAQNKGWLGHTPSEARVALALFSFGLRPSDVVEQFRLGPYRIDFAFPSEHLAIEADGWVHTAETVRAKDRKRDADLDSWGWKTIRIYCEDASDDVREQLRPYIKMLRRMRTNG